MRKGKPGRGDAGDQLMANGSSSSTGKLGKATIPGSLGPGRTLSQRTQQQKGNLSGKSTRKSHVWQINVQTQGA